MAKAKKKRRGLSPPSSSSLPPRVTRGSMVISDDVGVREKGGVTRAMFVAARAISSSPAPGVLDEESGVAASSFAGSFSSIDKEVRVDQGIVSSSSDLIADGSDGDDREGDKGK